jgi:putative nucleotidyltransferase with HDIG domain
MSSPNGSAFTNTFNWEPFLHHPEINRLQRLVEQQGGKLYLVGGAIRDYCLNKTMSSDLDFVLLYCDAAFIAQQFAAHYHRHCIALDVDWGIYRVVLESGLILDIANALNNNLIEDLARRDLTINAMAIDLDNGLLIDNHDGLRHLQAGKIVMIKPENFLDDPLRMLRVFRVAAQIRQASLDAETVRSIANFKNTLWTVAGERIQYEFLRFLSMPVCYPLLKTMADCGLLEVLIKDLIPTREIPANGFHHLGLFEHTLELVKQVEYLFDCCPKGVKEWVNQPMGGVYTRFGLIKLGCLLHDIGKPVCMGSRIDTNALEAENADRKIRLTFYGHEALGSKMIEPLLSDLKVSKEIRTFVTKLVRWHLYPCQFGPHSSEKSILRFFRRMGEDTLDIVLLALADRCSTCGEWVSQADMEASMSAHFWLMERYLNLKPVFNLPKLLNGNDIMELLNCSPGSQIKTILDQVQEQQQLGALLTPDDAKSWVLETFKPNKL